MKRRRPSKPIPLLILALMLCQGTPYAEEIRFRADTMRGSTGENRKTTVLQGHSWIKTKDIEIHADTIELSGADYETVDATGHVSGSNAKSGFTFTANSLSYNRKTGIVKLSGNVFLKDDENDVEANAHFIEYNQETETALMQIEVHLTQKDSVCTSALAVYRKNDQILEMSGSPKVVRGNDEFKAQRIVVNMKTDEIILDGRVRGTVEDSGAKD